MRRVIWVAWLGGWALTGVIPSVALAQNRTVETSPVDSKVQKPRTLLDTAVQLFYKSEYEEADAYLQQAVQVRDQLTPSEQARLDDTLRRNNDALKGRRVALENLQKASEAINSGRNKEAETLLKGLQSSRYLKAEERQIVSTMMTQVRGKGAPVRGTATSMPKQDPDSLMTDARRAFERRDYDQAESLAQAAKAAGYKAYMPWSDTPEKLMKEVATARSKAAASGMNSTARTTPSTDTKIQIAREKLEQAKMAVMAGDLMTARALVQQVEEMKVNLASWEPVNVEKLKNEIAKAEARMGKGSTTSGPMNQAPLPSGDPKVLVKEARKALDAGDLDRAEEMAKAARLQHYKPGLFDDTPENILADIVKARESANKDKATQMLADARKLLNEGRFDEAEKLTYQAEALRKSYPIWYMGERPDRLRSEIVQKRRVASKPNLPSLLDPSKSQVASTKQTDKAPSVTSVANLDPRQLQAQQMLMQARMHVNRGEYKTAIDLATQVKQMNVILPAGSDTPDQVIKAVETVMAAGDLKTNPAEAEMVRRKALQHLADARLAQKQNKLVEALQCVQQAKHLNAFYQPQDETPESIMVELKAAAMNSVKVYTDAAFTLEAQGKVKEAVDYLKYVQQLCLAYSLDASQATTAMAKLQDKLNQGTVIVQNKVDQLNTQVNATLDKGQQMLIDAQQALKAGQLTVARQLAQTLHSGPYNLKAEAGLLISQIDQSEYAAQIAQTKKLFEAFKQHHARKQYDAALSLSGNIQLDKLDAADRVIYQEIMASAEMQSKVIQASNMTAPAPVTSAPSTPSAPVASTVQPVAPTMPAPPVMPPVAPPTVPTPENQQVIAQATPPSVPPQETKKEEAPKTETPKSEGTPPEAPKTQGQGNLINDVRARQEAEMQRIREVKRQSELKASQLAGKGEIDAAIAELQDAVTQVQRSSLDRDMANKLEKQLNDRIQRFKTLAEQVTFAKMQKDKLNEANEKKTRILMAKQHQSDMVADLMKQYANFMKEGKYTEAAAVAMKARELDPDNVQADAAVFKANMMRNLSEEDRVRDGQIKGFTTTMRDLAESSTAEVNNDSPLSINKTILERANKRGVRPSTMPIKPIDKAVYNKLDSMVTVDFRNKKLYEVLDELRAMSGTNIVPQDEYLKQEGISLDSTIDLKLTNVSLKTALNFVLSKARLTYMVRDGVILVTTAAGKRENKITRTFQINDLIVPRDDMSTLYNPFNTISQIGPDGTPTQVRWNKNQVPYGTPGATESMLNGAMDTVSDVTPNDGRRVGQTMEKRLIQLITDTIDPGSWDTRGGSGHITFYPVGMQLIVSQTPDIQEQVADLLQRLRELQELQVTVEVRFITLTEDFYERVGVDMDLQIKTASTRANQQFASGNFAPPGQLNTIGNLNTIVGLTPGGTFTNSLKVPVNNTSFQASALDSGFAGFPGIAGQNGGLDVGLAFLSNIQVFLFMEAVQGDIRSNVLTAPKITLFNGQTASLSSNVTEPFVTSFRTDRDLFTGAIVFTPVTTPITTGLFLTVQAVVSADRRYVQLSLSPSISRLRNADRTFSPVNGLTVQQPSIESLNVSTTVMVPDGGTILMGGLKQMEEQRREFGPPVLSKMPYINRLFRNSMYGREARSLLLMVTPRIIIPEEEEERLATTFAF